MQKDGAKRQEDTVRYVPRCVAPSRGGMYGATMEGSTHCNKKIAADESARAALVGGFAGWLSSEGELCQLAFVECVM